MIRIVCPADRDVWRALRAALWPDMPAEEHETDIARYFWSLPADELCLVAEEEGVVVGFAELSVRPYADGCATDRVGYLEGWYVAPPWRRRGVGRALVAGGEAWARERRCREFASDTELENGMSQDAHVALGFAEVARVVCYRKSLAG